MSDYSDCNIISVFDIPVCYLHRPTAFGKINIKNTSTHSCKLNVSIVFGFFPSKLINLPLRH